MISCLDSHHSHSVLDLLARVQISSVLTVSTAWFTVPHKPRHYHVQIQHSYNDTIWVTEDHDHVVGEVDVIFIVSYQQRLQLIVSEWVYGKGELFWYEWQEARGYVSFYCIFLKRERDKREHPHCSLDCSLSSNGKCVYYLALYSFWSWLVNQCSKLICFCVMTLYCMCQSISIIQRCEKNSKSNFFSQTYSMRTMQYHSKV